MYDSSFNYSLIYIHVYNELIELKKSLVNIGMSLKIAFRYLRAVVSTLDSKLISRNLYRNDKKKLTDVTSSGRRRRRERQS